MTQLAEARPTTTLAAPDVVVSAPVAAAKPKGVIASFVEATKPGITRLVTATSVVGLVMAGVNRAWTGRELVIVGLGCAIGTALSAAGANAVNQFMERDRDALMNRTMRRPLPTGRVTPMAVLLGATALCIAGVLTLWASCGLIPALVSLTCIVTYVAFYTPLKTRTTLSTLVGAIPGALPPLIGWSAGSPTGGMQSLLEPGGVALFVLMCIWQIPHFLAIGWMYRDDYAKGGYVLLPVVDTDGRWTALTIALWTAALLPASVMPAIAMPDHVSLPYAMIAAVSSFGFGWLAWRLISCPDRPRARQLFFGSILHLPLLLAAMVGETLIRRFA